MIKRQYFCLFAVTILAFPSRSSASYKNEIVISPESPAQLVLSSPGDSQSSSPISIALVKAAFASTPISNVKLAAQVKYIQGGISEQGTVTLVARSDGSYEIDYGLKTGPSSENQTVSGDNQTCTWTDQAGAVHAVPTHNCLLGTAWFLPQLSLFSSSNPSTLTPVGSVDVSGESLWDIRSSSTFNSPHSADLMTRLSAVHLLVDPTSHTIDAMTFSIHPENDANRNIPVRVQFSDYRSTSGVLVPFHIQKFVNGTLMLDATVLSASIQ